MGIEAVSQIIAIFVAGSLGTAALLRNWRGKLCAAFAAVSAVFFLHDLLALLEGTTLGGSFASPSFHLWVTFLISPALFWLLGEMVPAVKAQALRTAGFFAVFSAVGALWGELPVFESSLRVSLVFAHLALLIPFGSWVWVLYQASGRAKLSRERARLRGAFLGACLLGVLLTTDTMHFLGVVVPPLGVLGRVLYLIFLYQTFIQKEVMTPEEVVTKVSLFAGIALMLSLIFLLLLVWVGERKDVFIFNTLIASFVILVLFDPIRNLTGRFARHLFLGRSYAPQRELATLSEQLIGVVEPAELHRRLVQTFQRARGFLGAALYVLDREGLSYVRIGEVSPETPGFVPEVSVSSPVVEYMTLRSGRPFVVETIEADRDSFRNAQAQRFCESCLEAMRHWGADLVLPFLGSEELVGFAVFKTEDRVVLSNDQLRLMVPITRQISALLKNARAFSRLRDRDKLAAVGEMAAGLAHEIKNPLGAIRGAAQLLSESQRQEGTSTPGAVGPAREEFLQIILDEADRLSRVLTDFLDYAKPRKNSPEAKCDPVRVVEHVANLCLPEARERNGAKFRWSLSAEKRAFEIDADPELLKQVLLNLFLNAVQAMEGFTAEPHLAVTVREIRPGRLVPGFRNFAQGNPWADKIWDGWEHFRNSLPGPYVEIALMDNGRGIAPHEREHIFTPFFTTKPKGTGMGLAICQRLVEGMGGTIMARPGTTGGTEFLIHLPVKRPLHRASMGLGAGAGTGSDNEVRA